MRNEGAVRKRNMTGKIIWVDPMKGPASRRVSRNAETSKTQKPDATWRATVEAVNNASVRSTRRHPKAEWTGSAIRIVTCEPSRERHGANKQATVLSEGLKTKLREACANHTLKSLGVKTYTMSAQIIATVSGDPANGNTDVELTYDNEDISESLRELGRSGRSRQAPIASAIVKDDNAGTMLEGNGTGKQAMIDAAREAAKSHRGGAEPSGCWARVTWSANKECQWRKTISVWTCDDPCLREVDARQAFHTEMLHQALKYAPWMEIGQNERTIRKAPGFLSGDPLWKQLWKHAGKVGPRTLSNTTRIGEIHIPTRNGTECVIAVLADESRTPLAMLAMQRPASLCVNAELELFDTQMRNTGMLGNHSASRLLERARWADWAAAAREKSRIILEECAIESGSSMEDLIDSAQRTLTKQLSDEAARGNDRGKSKIERWTQPIKMLVEEEAKKLLNGQLCETTRKIYASTQRGIQKQCRTWWGINTLRVSQLSTLSPKAWRNLRKGTPWVVREAIRTLPIAALEGDPIKWAMQVTLARAKAAQPLNIEEKNTLHKALEEWKFPQSAPPHTAMVEWARTERTIDDEVTIATALRVEPPPWMDVGTAQEWSLQNIENEVEHTRKTLESWLENRAMRELAAHLFFRQKKRRGRAGEKQGIGPWKKAAQEIMSELRKRCTRTQYGDEAQWKLRSYRRSERGCWGPKLWWYIDVDGVLGLIACGALTNSTQEKSITKGIWLGSNKLRLDTGAGGQRPNKQRTVDQCTKTTQER